MKVIGLTGGIGSGKSTVARFLAELGAVIIDSDSVGHEAFKPGTKLWGEIVAVFGKHILTPTSEIDRKKLGRFVFGNPDSLSRLNHMMHPRMYEIVKARIEEYRQQGAKVVVLEAPLLIEAGWTSLVDKVWVTVAPQPTVIRRLQEKLGLAQQQSLSRIKSQLPSEERLKHADVVIDTDCTLDELRAKVEKLWLELQA